MKKNLLKLVILIFSIGGSAGVSHGQSTSGTKPRHKLSAPDDNTPTETTLDIDEGAFLGFAGARWGTRWIDGKWVTSSGLRGMWLYREALAFGLDLTFLSGRLHPFKDAAKADFTQDIVTWGLSLERIFNPRREFHLYAGGTIGRGASAFSVDEPKTLPHELEDSKMFYFIAPEVGLRWNLTKYTRPFAVANVMVPFGAKGNDKIETNKLTSFSLLIGINVGNFVL